MKLVLRRRKSRAEIIRRFVVVKPAISSINSRRRRRLLFRLLLLRRRKEINHVKQTLVAESGGKFGWYGDHFWFPRVSSAPFPPDSQGFMN